HRRTARGAAVRTRQRTHHPVGTGRIRTRGQHLPRPVGRTPARPTRRRRRPRGHRQGPPTVTVPAAAHHRRQGTGRTLPTHHRIHPGTATDPPMNEPTVNATPR